MALEDAASNVSSMLDNLKSRLGFNRGEEEAYDDYDGHDDFDDYGEYGNSDDYEEFAEYGENYSEDAPIGGFRPVSPYEPRSRFDRRDITSSLVNRDDVMISTPMPDLRPSAETAGSSASGLSSASASASASSPSSSYDPYEAYTGLGTSLYTPSRSLTVIRPRVYGDVERVARVLKTGDAVVLVMHETPEELSKRILDFSFGVASALDANVECLADKVFAIARGSAISEDEKTQLRSQGAL